jgi:glycosyltransferase involved in cell wall biosynthesis
MLVRNTFVHDARVQREAGALVEAGHEVTVIALPLVGAPASELADGVRLLRPPPVFGLGLRKGLRRASEAIGGRGEAPSSAVQRGPIRILASLLSLALRGVHAMINKPIKGLRGLLLTRAFIALCVHQRPDVIHSHDLYTLYAGRVAKRRTGAALVYDSHELAVDRAEHGRLKSLVSGATERLWIRSVDCVITVSPSIGDFLTRRYGVRPPTIILNVPRRNQTGAVRDFRKLLDIEDSVRILLFQGGVFPNRGLENLGEALNLLDDCIVVLMGSDYGFGATLQEHFLRLGVSDRVRQLPPVAVDELLSWTAAADIGICTIVDGSLSERLSLPNKLFEYMAAGVPVVASDLPEIRRVVVEEGFGELCDPGDPSSIASAIRRILEEPDREARYRANALRAATKYNWDTEKQKLIDLYLTLEDGRGQSRGPG